MKFPWLSVLLTSDFRLQTSSPIIVKLVEPKEQTIYDVLVGSLGLTGVMVLAAVGAALVFGAVLFWVRSRSA
jgi:hypothetical protein